MTTKSSVDQPTAQEPLVPLQDPFPMEPVKVGLVGTFNEVFIGDFHNLYSRSITDLERLSRERGFDFHPVPNGLWNAEQADQARRELVEAGVDFLLVQTTAFPDGDIMPRLAGTGARIGLWALPEGAVDGALPLNSFCGMNMMGGIIGQYLTHHQIPFKWFYGMADHDLFRPRFEVTLDALRAIKNLAQAKVAQVGGRAPGFHDLAFDERAFAKRFGLEVYTLHTISELVQMAKHQSANLVRQEVERMKSIAVECAVAEIGVERAARMYLSLRDLALERGYNGMGVSCWPAFQDDYAYVPCSAYSRLNEEGIVSICEGDLPGAVSMLILNYLNGGRATLMDLSDFDEIDRSVFLYHCGVAPTSYADERGIILTPHSILGLKREDGTLDKSVGTVVDMIFRADPITLTRVMPEAQALFIAAGRTSATKKTGFHGSRGWVEELSMNGEPISVRDLVNTVMVQRLPHHFAMTYGQLTERLLEFAAWLGLDLVQSVPYQTFMQPPVGGK